MSCTSWTEPHPAAASTAQPDRRLPAVAARVGALLARAWRAYWDWRARRMTVLILQSLDRRTLHDIGIDPSEVESLVSDATRDRRRRHDVSRR